MGSLHSILQVIDSKDNRGTYERVPRDDPDQPEIERNPINQISQPQHQFHHHTTERIDKHYSLIWLDEHSNKISFDTEYTKTILCKFNQQYCSYYSESNEFLNDILNGRHRNENILLIVSGSLAEQVLPKIQMRVSIVIIFCHDYTKYIKLKTTRYKNVVDVCTDHETLKNLIQRELTLLKLCLSDTIPIKSLKFLISMIKSDSEDDSNTIIINETSFYYILIVDLLKQMPETNQSKDIWLNKCREYYHEDENGLKEIEEFRKKYKADEAILWYVKESFIYRLINHAFRTEDITLWYLSRYFIADICKQMEIVYQQQKYSEKLILYHGQRMSIKELESIKELAKINGLFCTTAFFSTTKNILVAKSFSGEIGDSNDDEIVSVLFEIILDSANLKTVIFVDINQHLLNKDDISNHKDEVLFTIGSVFRITNIEQDFKLYKIYMEATDDGADIIRYHLDLMINKYKNININLRFGRYLLDMNYLGKAESYFQMLLHELECSNNAQCFEEDFVFINNSLGELNMRATNYKEAYQYFQTAYTIQSNNRTSTNLFISVISFANYYKAIGEHVQAHKYYMDALIKLNENAEKNQININRVMINIASIHAIYGEYSKALKLCLEIQNSFKETQLIHPLYCDMIICQGLIGDIYFLKENYNEAEKYYLNIFNMCKQYLCIGDKQFIYCICSLTELYRKKFKNNIEYAFDFCKKQLELHEQHLSKNHLSVAHLLMKLGDIKQDINYYEKALEILIHHDHREYLTIAQCYKFLGDYYLKNEQINENTKEALEYYYKIREIYVKIYPKNHQRIVEIQDFIDFNHQQTSNVLVS